MHTIHNSFLKVLLVFITFQALCSPYSFRTPSKSKNLFKNFLSFKEDTNQTYDAGKLGDRNNSSKNNKGDSFKNNGDSSGNNSGSSKNNVDNSKNNSDKFENNFERIGNSKSNGERFGNNIDKVENNFRKSKNNGDRFGNSVVENNYGKSKSNGDRFGNNVDWVGNNVGNIGESYKNNTELLRYNGDDGVEVILRKNLQIPVQNATKYYYLFDKEGLGGIHRSISQLFPSKLNHIQMSDRCKLKRPNNPDNYPKNCEKMEEFGTELNDGSEPSVQINIVSPVILVNVNESNAINFSDMTKKKADDDKWKGCKTFPKYVYA